MSRSYVCIEWNETTRQCEGAAWVEQASIADVLPTVEQAQAVGIVMFTTLVIIASMSLLSPSRYQPED